MRRPRGGLRAGEPLPSIRPLAEELRVNRNTVAKAYAELESQGVIETLARQGLLSEGQPFAPHQVRPATICWWRKSTAPSWPPITCKWMPSFLALVAERLENFGRKAAKDKGIQISRRILS